MKPELEKQIVELAHKSQIDPAALLAIVSVESTGVGFWNVDGYADPVPVINFEAHRFHDLTDGKYAKIAPDISEPGPDDQFGKTEWYRFTKAAKLDRENAIKATSWGLMQVMGENYSWLGYDSVEDFVSRMKESEIAQIEAGLRFLQRRKIDEQTLIYWANLRRWDKVAHGYNGAGYARYHYHTRIGTFFAAWKKKY